MTDLVFVKETPEAWEYEGLAIPYGGPANGQDLTGSHFTAKSDLCLDWFPDGGRPLLYRHGFDPDVKAVPIGKEAGAVREDDRGRWYRIQIERAKQYASEVKQLADEGLLSLSSGAVDHLTKIAAKTGEIKMWPWVELSLVTSPANPEALLYKVKSLDAVEHISIVDTSVPEPVSEEATKGWLPEGTTQGDLDDGDFAWLANDKTLPDSERRKLPYKIHGEVSEAGWRAAWSRAHQAGTDFSGGPSQSEVIAKLEANKPAGVEAKSLDAVEAEKSTEPEPEAVETLGEAIREGRRNSTNDMGYIQNIHDMAASLGAVCSAEKEAPPAPRLVITGTVAEKDEPDLSALTRELSAVATLKAKELLRVS